MIKKISFLVAVFSLAVWVSPSMAAKPNFTPEIPEVAGVYDVPGQPGMKVRVFVHNTKPAKPSGGSSLTCGLADPSSNAFVNGAGWIIPTGTWNYKINPNVPSTISADLNNIVSNSFNAWTSINSLNSKVTMNYAGATSVNRAVKDGQNIIAWGRTSGSALGVTYIWYQNGVASEVDTIMNNKFSWNWGDGGASCAWTSVYDAQNILTHELGHWFGLDDFYTTDYENNTMYGYGAKHEVKKNTPEAGDVAGIDALY